MQPKKMLKYILLGAASILGMPETQAQGMPLPAAKNTNFENDKRLERFEIIRGQMEGKTLFERLSVIEKENKESIDFDIQGYVMRHMPNLKNVDDKMTRNVQDLIYFGMTRDKIDFDIKVEQQLEKSGYTVLSGFVSDIRAKGFMDDFSFEMTRQNIEKIKTDNPVNEYEPEKVDALQTEFYFAKSLLERLGESEKISKSFYLMTQGSDMDASMARYRNRVQKNIAGDNTKKIPHMTAQEKAQRLKNLSRRAAHRANTTNRG
ncbi:MAG: hypothetical protein LBU87_02625 [Lactobacillales bacterium]|jgi:hypothetical protein|nr:hypothetical protein [Lactobacillales bacterium]